ncbi:MAG TPA: hypothetical protein VHG91_11820 [Longimicrobium sp.]|nr:hypothetical protein [Longimicrobium sp.]
MNIDAPELDRAITVRDAYRAMERFLAAHLARGESSTASLVACAGLRDDGSTGDPAALHDYLDALAAVTSDPGRDFEIVVDDDLADADRRGMEVRVTLPDGSQRWCFFMTPAALASCGDWVPGTEIPMHRGERHMFIVGACTEEIIARVLHEAARDGELLSRTRPLAAPQRLG